MAFPQLRTQRPFKVSVPTAYVIAADGGTYSISGTAATFARTWKLAADSGSYSVAGTAATLKAGYKVSANGGTYSVSGTAASLFKGYKVSADSGSYSVSGTAATFRNTYVIAAASGTYTLSGTTADLEVGRRIAADGGTYTQTGSDATLTYGTIEVVPPLSFSEGLRRNRYPRAFHPSIRQAFKFSVGLVHYTLTADAGSYGVTGSSATLIAPTANVSARDTRKRTWPRHFAPSPWGQLRSTGRVPRALSSTPAPQTYTLNVDGGSYSVNGTAATLKFGHLLSAASGSYSQSGTAATLRATRLVTATGSSYAITGANATLVYVPVEPFVPSVIFDLKTTLQRSVALQSELTQTLGLRTVFDDTAWLAADIDSTISLKTKFIDSITRRANLD